MFQTFLDVAVISFFSSRVVRVLGVLVKRLRHISDSKRNTKDKESQYKPQSSVAASWNIPQEVWVGGKSGVRGLQSLGESCHTGVWRRWMGVPGDGLWLHNAGRPNVITGQTRRARYVMRKSILASQVCVYSLQKYIRFLYSVCVSKQRAQEEYWNPRRKM